MQWIEPGEVSVPENLLGAVGGHPLVSRGLINRGLATPEAALPFLEPDRYRPRPPRDLVGMDQAASRIERATRQGEPICVWGDFDVDGQTATTVLVSTLHALGADARYYIPHRKRESHGFHAAGVERLIAEGVGLFLTCDTGIRDHEAVAVAAMHDTDVIVTDHHDPAEDLPPSFAVLNPKLLPDNHPQRELPGVGTAFLLAQELLSNAGKSEQADHFLDLVALGIVADLARQPKDVRYYLQKGLQAIRSSQRPGLVALIDTAGLSQHDVTDTDIGFALAPRLNALGRLGDANRAVEFLRLGDASEAAKMAQELEALNARRRLLTDQVLQAALEQIEREPREPDMPAIIVQNDTWPEGVIGLVAAKLVDRYDRPAIVISTGDDQIGRASARSVAGIDISSALEENSAYLERYGGHPMAAGFAIHVDRIAEFRRALSATLREARVRPARLLIDAALPLSELTLDLVLDLERLAPFGPGNPPLTLVSKRLFAEGTKTLGRSADHLEVRVADSSGAGATFLWWNGAKADLPKGAFDLAYRPRLRTYKGEQQLQLEWIEARSVAPAPPVSVKAKKLQLVDFRNEADPAGALLKLIASDVQIWSEANEQEGVSRQDLALCKRLVIWTVPPGPSELRHAVRTARPEVVYTFAQPGLGDSPKSVLEELAGLAKYAIQHKRGRVRLEHLAAKIGQRVVMVRAGLNWLNARGELEIIERGADEWRVGMGHGTKGDAGVELEELLRETAAFRDYYRRASTDALRRLLW